MSRLILLGIAIVVLILVVQLFFPSSPRKKEEPGETELVCDPNCDTYVPKKQSVRRVLGGAEHFFCSERCADEFARKRG